MKILAIVILWLVTAASFGQTQLDQIAREIESRFPANNDLWEYVGSSEEFRQLYDRSRAEYLDYLELNHPELLQSARNLGRDAIYSVFMVFRSQSGDVHRGGWYYEWDADEITCGQLQWDFQYYEYAGIVDLVYEAVSSGGITKLASCSAH
ncbi:MAG: hypothetical protein Q7T44_08150 [Parvibaculum sp.]|nr:hypothetical protein [Parvibaculum sp.]